MGIEYERKFRATAEQLEKMEQYLSGPKKHYEMRTTYYDTPSQALSQKHFTLRCRKENDLSVCTLKAPAGDARGEWETEHSDIFAAIDVLCALGAPQALKTLTQEGIVPVCGAAFHRIAIDVTFGESRLEVALDRGVLLGGDQELPLFEAEVELKEGSREDTDAFARLLAAKFQLVPEKHSKFRRALRLQQGGSL